MLSSMHGHGMAFIAELNDTPPCECPFSLEQLYLERINRIPNPESLKETRCHR